MPEKVSPPVPEIFPEKLELDPVVPPKAVSVPEPSKMALPVEPERVLTLMLLLFMFKVAPAAIVKGVPDPETGNAVEELRSKVPPLRVVPPE